MDRCCRVLLLYLAAAPAAAAVVVLGGYLYVAAQTGGISSIGLFGEVVLVIWVFFFFVDSRSWWSSLASVCLSLSHSLTLARSLSVRA